MKRRILVRIVLVLILLLALYPLTKFVILPLFHTSGELEGHDVPLYGYSEPDTPMVMEKQKDTIARYRGESSNFTRSDRLSRSTSEKPIAAARKPFIVCNTVSQNGKIS